MKFQLIKALTVSLALFCLTPSVKASDALFGAVMSYCQDKGCKSGAFYYHFEKNIDRYCSGVKYVNSEVTQSDKMAIIEQMVIDQGLPANISLLPLVESGLDPDAVSSVGAVGIWQFMEETGIDMGLVINANIDQRRDIKASTQAAIKYLHWLKKQFNGDLDLSIIAYNAGVGRVQKLIKEQFLGNTGQKHQGYSA